MALLDRAYGFSTEVFAETELITCLNQDIAARDVTTKAYFVLKEVGGGRGGREKQRCAIALLHYDVTNFWSVL